MVISNVGLDSIIAFAAPILTFLYPGTLVVIVLSLLTGISATTTCFGLPQVARCALSVLEGFGLPIKLDSQPAFQAVGLAGLCLPAYLGLWACASGQKPSSCRRADQDL